MDRPERDAAGRRHADAGCRARRDARSRRVASRSRDSLPPLWHWLYFLPIYPCRRRVRMVTPPGANSCRRFRCHVECGAAVASNSTSDPGRGRDFARFAHPGRDREDRPNRAAGLRHGAARDQRRRSTRDDRGARHRVSRPSRARQRRNRPEGDSGRARLDAHHRSRSRAAFPLLGIDVQQPSHSLRSAVRHRRRRLSRADRAWSAHCHAPGGPAAPPSSPCHDDTSSPIVQPGRSSTRRHLRCAARWATLRGPSVSGPKHLGTRWRWMRRRRWPERSLPPSTRNTRRL